MSCEPRDIIVPTRSLCGRHATPVMWCEACRDEVGGHMAHAKPVFVAMLQAGMPRDKANDAMSYLLDISDPSTWERVQ